MTDMSGYAIPQPQMGGYQDDSINLNFGLGTTDGLALQVPPEGTHRWQVVKIEKQFTGNGEIMVNAHCRCIESHTQGAIGTTHREGLVIPGQVRAQQDPDKWKVMMKMLRQKLEGMTGRPFREDNLQLSPNRDLMGCIFIARCYHEKSEVEQEDGSKRVYTNSRLTDWTPPGVPQPQAQQGTLVMSGGPALGQQQMAQPPQPSINLGQAMQQAAQPAVSPEQMAAQQMQPAMSPAMAQAVQPSPEELAHQQMLRDRAAAAQQAEQTAADMAANTVQATPGINLNIGGGQPGAGMTFPTEGPPQQPTNGEQTPAPAASSANEEPF